MRHVLRVIPVLVTGLLLTGCLSSEPKVAEAAQVTAEQRAALGATEGAGTEPAGGAGTEPAGSEAPGGGGGGQWVAIDIEYDQAPTELPAGPAQISLHNKGVIEHDVTFEELGDERVLIAAPGETVTADIELEAGEYVYYCSVPGHRATMEGTLTVSG